MKKVIVLLVAVIGLCYININAQISPNMLIHYKDKSISTVILSDVDSITFTPCQNDTSKCGSYLTDSRDGKSYKTVLIGTQCWMKENLNVGKRIDGIFEQSNNDIIEKYCYQDSESNCNIYGGLYQWNEMMLYVINEKNHGICPARWHLPTDTEWTTLIDYLGGEDVAGNKMREMGANHWTSPNTGATNSSGFSALPGGYLTLVGSFQLIHNNGYWWTATENEATTGWLRFMRYNFAKANSSSDDKGLGFSVRCLKDISK